MNHRPIAALLALALLPGCGPDASVPAANSRAPQDAAVRPAALEAQTTGVTLQARDTRRSALLERLAKLASFQLTGVPNDDRIMSIDRVNAPLEQILAELLVGEPYSLRYAVDEARGAHRLQRVTLGDVQSELKRLRREDRLERRMRAATKRGEARRQRRENDSDLTPEQRLARREEQRAQRAAEREQREREIASALAASEPETRARGAGKLDPDDEGALPQLLELSEDSEPEVRAAAVSRLALSDSRSAHEALANALDDPDPRVVIEALDGIAFQQDESAIPLITRLLDHPDSEVRRLAAETKQFLE